MFFGGIGDDYWVGFSVVYDGYGVTESDYPRMFERFFREKASKKSRTSGTGLGLVILNQLIVMHNREISVSMESMDLTPLLLFNYQ